MVEPRVLVWDLETARHHKRDEPWGTYASRCGVSVACTLDPATGDIKFYSEKDIAPNDIESLAKDLLYADYTVGFNSLKWDWPVLEKTLRRELPRREVDLLQVIRCARPETWSEGDWSLEGISMRMWQMGKTGAGMAPTLWAKNWVAKLMSYVARDVVLTTRIYKHILRAGTLEGPHGPLDCGEVMRRVIEQARETRSATRADIA